MKSILYSIGYSGFLIKDFIQTLRDNNISVLVDVRSFPFSSYYTDYNKDILANTLKQSGIRYRHYDQEFGARQENRSYYTPAGYLDFSLFCHSECFLQGVSKLCAGMERGYTFALMCAEKNPISCHRAILVSRAFAQRGYPVIHLLPHGKTLTQEEIDAQLLDLYFPDRTQLTMFGGNESEEELLDRAYQKQNAVIGYHIEGE